MIIIASADEISLDDNSEDNFELYLAQENRTTLVFTPYLDGLSSNIRDHLGIDSVDEIYGNENITEWDVDITTSFSDYTIGDDFQYTG